VLALSAGVACSDGSVATPTTVTLAPTTTTHTDDGALVVGAILPSSGAAAEIGASMAAGLSLALDEINEAGGVNGRPVRLITRDEGDNPTTTALAMQDIVRGVDAIIGPTSSSNALGTLGIAVDAGILACSPTASALALDEFPDNGLFFRTVPSFSLQATAIASLVEASGGSTAVVVYLDDPFGRPFAAATQAAIVAGGTTVTQFIGFTPTAESIADAVQAVADAAPDVVAVIADGISGPTIINAMDTAAGPGVTYVVNDAIRRPATSTQPFPARLARRVVGVAPLALSGSAGYTDALLAADPTITGLFAHNAYDCLSIIALAATASDSTKPGTIAAAVPGVTASGTGCDNYTDCILALEQGRNINYNGPSGNLSIGSDGNVATANFERFGFDATGRDVSDGEVSVGNG
jgi:branched-chain amino acid transport system substrate-binding protein